MKKFLLCVILVFALCLTACGGDEKETSGFGINSENSATSETKNNTSQNGDGVKSDESQANNGGQSNATSNTDEGTKGTNNGGTLVTDGTTSSNSENTFNVGGISLQAPEGYTRKSVFVGAGLTFESTKSSSMLREYYYETEKMDALKATDATDNQGDGLSDGAGDIYTTVYSPNYVIFDVEGFVTGGKNDSLESNIVANYLDEYELVSDDELTVAGMKARKVAYKGKNLQDCYREGPVKQFVEATLITTVIYNDIDKRAIVVLDLCKTGKYEEVEKQLKTMFETAAMASESSNMVGLFGASYVEIGAFSMEISECFGQLLDCSYDMYGETYTNSYGSMSGVTQMLGQSAFFIAQMQSQFGGMGFGGMGGFEGNPGDLGEFDGDMGDWENSEVDFGGDFGDGEGNFSDGAGYGGNQGMVSEYASILADMDKDWLNLSAMRTVITIAEFENLLNSSEDAITELFTEVLPDVTCTLSEKIEVDGMQGIRFTFEGDIDGEDTELKLFIINNNKGRFVLIGTTVTAVGSEQSAAFDELLANMKNLAK